MDKISKISDNLESVSTDTDTTSRRDFFKKTAVYSASLVAASSVLSPIKAMAGDDTAITHEAEWGTKLGKLVTDNLYGLPSPYEHNNIRRTMDLLSSGDMYASVSMCPIHESEGIITPNGLFFCRDHGGTAIVDPDKFRLMIHGKVKKEIVLTLRSIKKISKCNKNTLY